MSDLSSIHVIAELDRYSIKYEYGSEKEVKVLCPFHDDKTPNCHIDIRDKVFYCHSADCKASGDFLKLLSRFLGVPRKVVIEDLSKRYNLNQEKVINPETIERYHAKIWQAKPLIAELHARAVTDSLIRKYRLGENEGRVTIPIPNEFGSFVGLRKYLPGAPGKDKMRNSKGFSKMRLFPIEQLQYPTVVICGGEMKAIVAADQLNRFNIGAITATSGEGNWHSEFTRLLRGKRMLTCLDIDSAGQKSSNSICLQIRSVADWVGNVVLPLDADKYPKGDINDFIAAGGELKPLLDAAAEYVPTATLNGWHDETEPIAVDLAESINADKTAKRIKLSALISMMDSAPYVIPREVEIVCQRDAKGGICAICPVVIEDKSKFNVPAESPTILELVANPKEKQLQVVKSAVGVPPLCNVCDFKAHSYFNVEDVKLSNKLDITQRNSDRALQPALCIGNTLELNECYDLTGRMFPHPKTQQATLLISGYHTSQDALSTYSLDGVDECSIFWPDDWSKESIAAKLDEIYSDFETNVTGIFMRKDIHLAVDLTYHSPLYFSFDGRDNIKGYMETLIIGDSSQGKSGISCGVDGNGGLMKFYNLGTMVDCRNASVAGLLGGCQQSGTRWWISWGAIPKNDRRLVILEELKGVSTDILGHLTTMRSSGRAQIPKIETRETFARARLLANSNARGDLKMSQYNFGVQAIKELIGAPEDVRRFDLFQVVDERDIDSKIINQLRSNRPVVKQTYESEICRRLVLWAWTRRGDNIFFTDDATALILQTAVKLTGIYSEVIPIVDKGSMRYKLARMAAALAIRTFSCSADWESVIVEKCHVEYIAEFVERTYSAPTFGYLDFTRASSLSQTLLDVDVIKQFINNTPFALDLCNSLQAANRIDINDLCDWCGWQKDDAQHLLSLLVRKHALLREGRYYRKSAPFITLLRDMVEKGLVKNRPSHLPTKEF